MSSLLLANLLPLAGVYLWGWNLTDLLLLYWLENAVIGLYTVLAMLSARPAGQSWWIGLAGKLFIVPFFVVHYGMFWLGHGIFLVAFFGRDAASSAGSLPSTLLSPLTYVSLQADLFTWPLALMLVSHGVSFVTNFLAAGEFRAVSAPQLMMRPYGRVIVLHVTIVLGGFLALALGPSLGVLLLFVLLKIVVDVAAHLREVRKVAARGTQEMVPAVASRGTSPSA